MIINPSKKALPLFNYLPKAADKKLARSFSDSNPLFSWHANYFNVKRKKILLLVNDLTYFPIVLVGIDAKNKKQLNEIIRAAIKEVFQAAKIPQQKIIDYLDLAGEIEVSAGYNRVITGIINNMITSLEYHERFNLDVLIDIKLSIDLADSVFKESFPLDELRKVFKEPLVLHDISQEDLEENVVKRDWKSLADCKAGDLSEKEIDEALANNQRILKAFQQYLEQHEKVTKKTVNRQLSTIEYYLSGYLIFYGFNQAISTFAIISDFFSWGARKNLWISESAVKKAGSSMKKFYQFLIAAGEVKESDMPEIREQIEMGVDDGSMTLMMMADWY
ncbi:cell division protein FtsA [Enterococcus sp. AZ007]|uniref:cell division protein FtsA n=1 Tax=Enterococcus sp. AZ007 TaxID=2774839 RepID=UPI003F1E6485